MSRLKTIFATLRSRLSFPLLAKELIEQSNRKRTYVLRTVYAALLFGFSLLFLFTVFDRYQRYGGPFNMLGRGREMFFMLVAFQFTGLFLFLPAMVCGVITYEKERQSLQLLLITDLRPWEIIIQKLAGRLIPMGTFLLLMLPLMAVAYSFGGVTGNAVSISVLLMALSLLQVGAAAIMCSAFARSTAAAFFMTYLLLLLIYFGLAVLGLIFDGDIRNLDLVYAMCPVFHLVESLERGRDFWEVFIRAIPVMVTIPVLLGLARVFLTTRASVPPRNVWLVAFAAMDRFFNGINAVLGGFYLFKDRASLPEYAPIAWRETTKKGLGQPHYLTRILVLVEVPVLIVATVLIANASARSFGRQVYELSVVFGILWPITALMFCVAAANMIVTERSRQTLDLLLTTPLTGSQILWQKMAGMRRLMGVMFVPFATVFVIEAWWEGEPLYASDYGNDTGRRIYIVSSFLSYFIYIPMITWLAVLLSMRARSQAKAIMTSVGVFVAWCLVPLCLLGLFNDLFHRDIVDGGPIPLLLASPMMAISLTEGGDLDMRDSNEWASIIVNYAWYGGILLIMRFLCYYNADRWLGRVRGTDHDAESFVAVERSSEPEEGGHAENQAQNRPSASLDLDPAAGLTHNSQERDVPLEWIDEAAESSGAAPSPLPPEEDDRKDQSS